MTLTSYLTQIMLFWYMKKSKSSSKKKSKASNLKKSKSKSKNKRVSLQIKKRSSSRLLKKAKPTKKASKAFSRKVSEASKKISPKRKTVSSQSSKTRKSSVKERKDRKLSVKEQNIRKKTTQKKKKLSQKKAIKHPSHFVFSEKKKDSSRVALKGSVLKTSSKKNKVRPQRALSSKKKSSKKKRGRPLSSLAKEATKKRSQSRTHSSTEGKKQPKRQRQAGKSQRHLDSLLEARKKNRQSHEKEIILTDAEGRRYCRLQDCDQEAIVLGYCRYHYLLYLEKMQRRKRILSEGKLQKDIEDLSSRYSHSFLQLLKRDLSNEKNFMKAVQELEVDEPEQKKERDEDKDVQNYREDIQSVLASSSDSLSLKDDDYS